MILVEFNAVALLGSLGEGRWRALFAVVVECFWECDSVMFLDTPHEEVVILVEAKEGA